MPKYDDVSWHLNDDRPDEAAYIHIAFFLTWCISNNLAMDSLAGETQTHRERLLKRQIAPGAYKIWIEHSKLTHNEMNEAGNAFSKDYYSEDGYLTDYANTFVENSNIVPQKNLTGRVKIEAKRNAIRMKMTKPTSVKTIYEVPDTWESYDRIAYVLSRRYQEWSKYGPIT